ncbi:ArnT family glycosyltransferase [Flavicella marina]|uniref:ArnT family glycosyltransferase n=1 Tax=Flavicella marina TaxID=1475951 RepID=UPI001264EA1E|nr:glycosyltransferase family 39 protein [Flavicella marina]
MKKKWFVAILIVVALLNILQSYSTELLQDEAYYWMYSKYLDWGYFDHPPLVAIYIFVSDFLFSDELGVRFISAIQYSLTVYLLWTLIDIPNKYKYGQLFLLTVLSTFLFNVYGFITVPDTPLLFFMAIYLIAYKNILSTGRSKHYVLLSVAIAGLLYSKYTGILIVFFTVLSNLQLLKNKKFWLSVVGVVLLFCPHLFWQYNNDFPSIRYHLYERTSGRTYRMDYTIMHFVNQIAIIGFTFPIIYLAFYKNLKNKDLFQKALNYIVIGFISFFFIMSFKGPTQAQWTIPITFPLIIITFLHLTQNQRAKKTFVKLAIVNLVIICFARIILANDGILPIQLETHGNKQWVENINQQTKGKQKIFLNSYQNASLYSFYSKEITAAYNNYDSRKNQFNLLDIQNNLENKTVVHISGNSNRETNYIFAKKKKDTLYGSTINSFFSIKDLKYTYKNLDLESGINKKTINIYNPYSKSISLKDVESIIVLKDKQNQTQKTVHLHYTSVDNVLQPNSNSSIEIEFNITKNTSKKIDHFDIAIRNNTKMAFQKVNH